MRFAGEEELAARGLGDGCGDLMFFSSVLDFFIYYGSLVVSYRLVSRLARASRGASRPFFLPSHCLLVLFSSRLVVRLVSHLVFPSRPACSSRSIPVPSSIVSSYRLAVASCLLVSFPFHCLSYRLADFDRTFLRGRRGYPYHHDDRAFPSPAACGSSPLAYPLRCREAASVPVMRHPVMRRRGRQGMGENGKMS